MVLTVIDHYYIKVAFDLSRVYRDLKQVIADQGCDDALFDRARTAIKGMIADVIAWCEHNTPDYWMAPPSDSDISASMLSDTPLDLTFVFLKERDAMLFKLFYDLWP